MEYLNALFPRAAREGVSDIHFEDDGDHCFIRFRNRGVLEIVDVVSRQVSADINAKIRTRSRMALVERMSPLDGKFGFQVDGRVVDVRVSVLPLGSGESVVCRLLDQSAHLVSLDEIRSLLRLRDSPDDSCGSVNALIDEHIHHVKARIDGLLALQTQLLDLRQRCSQGLDKDHCGILQRLEVNGGVAASEAEPSHVGRSHGH